MSSDFQTFWRAAPPVSRTITAAALILSIPAHIGLLPFPFFTWLFWRPLLLQFPPHLWRIFTSFILTHAQWGMISDPYFLYTYGSYLERGCPRFTQPGDFATYLLFVCSFILLLDGFILSGMMFISPLIMAFAYTYSQDEPEKMMTFVVIPMRKKFLPFAMLFFSLIMSGPEAVLHELTGLLAAHCFDFLTRIWPTFGVGSSQPLIQTPAFMKRWVGGTADRARGYGVAMPGRGVERTAAGGVPPARPAGGNAPRGGSSWTSGFTGGGGNWRGSGHRLGGD